MQAARLARRWNVPKKALRGPLDVRIIGVLVDHQTSVMGLANVTGAAKTGLR
jgi:hypothetical protein